MADVTEDVPSSHQEVDLSDETQDFRFLSHLASYDDSQSTLPKRGEKDFEPNPTLAQANVLESARQAMQTALSAPRIHRPKTHNIGTFDPVTGKTVVRKPKGSMFETLGISDNFNRLFLLPEEALYLLERGSLDVRWPVSRDDEDDQGDMPMSLQGAYAAMMGRDGLTTERLIVFSGLRRLGYTVMRASTWSEEGVPSRYEPDVRNLGVRDSGSTAGLLPRFLKWLCASTTKSCPSFGPLVAPGLYRNYHDIYRVLALIPYHDPSKLSELPWDSSDTPYRLTYQVWKPATIFRKSSPPEPDFHVAVVDARTTATPTLSELSALLERTPYTPPGKEGHLHGRLKQGWRNVILAVVDQGVVSYLRVSETGFGAQPLFEERRSTGGDKTGSGRGAYKGRGGQRGGKRGKR